MSDLTILLIGGGGRESTLAWKLAQSPRVKSVIVCPGNGGTARLPKCQNLATVSVSDFQVLVEVAKSHNCNLVVPGPEDPLVNGVADYFTQNLPGVPVFGPSKLAAQLEGSKRFSKDFMKRHNIPTAAYEAFTDYEAAREYLTSISHNVVLKADGLAAGKGVIIPKSKTEALEALKSIMVDKEFGDAGNEVVIEEFLEGEEISILSLCDGTTFKSLPPAQDHKRAFDNDQGPNTGGMGTYAPASVATPAILAQIDETVFKPTMAGMRAEGYPFIGCLFSGFMLTSDGPRLLEYNVRFGDPETESVLPLLESDLAELMLACCSGTLSDADITVTKGLTAVTIIMAAGGYPGKYPKLTPMVIREDEQSQGVHYFHAGTIIDEQDVLRTNGGRVIAATATAESIPEAVAKAYQAVERVEFEGKQFRTDIARREMVRLGFVETVKSN